LGIDGIGGTRLGGIADVGEEASLEPEADSVGGARAGRGESEFDAGAAGGAGGVVQHAEDLWIPEELFGLEVGAVAIVEKERQ